MSNVPAAFLVQRPQKVPAAFCVKRPQLVVSPPENNSATCSSQTSPSCTRRSKQVTYSRASSSSATSTRATGTEANRTRGTPTMDSHVARKALYCLGWGKNKRSTPEGLCHVTDANAFNDPRKKKTLAWHCGFHSGIVSSVYCNPVWYDKAAPDEPLS